MEAVARETFYRNALKGKSCPECGGLLSEVDRSDEGDVCYVWYECSKDGCDGQWLEKFKI